MRRDLGVVLLVEKKFYTVSKEARRNQKQKGIRKLFVLIRRVWGNLERHENARAQGTHKNTH